MNPTVNLDPVQFTKGLANVLARVSVSGPENIANMKLVFDGLQVLMDSLRPQPPADQPTPEEEKEE